MRAFFLIGSILLGLAVSGRAQSPKQLDLPQLTEMANRFLVEDLVKARPYLEEIQGRSAGSPDERIAYYIALSFVEEYRRNGDKTTRSTSIAKIREYLQKFPDSENTTLLQFKFAELLTDAKQFDEAVSLYQKVIDATVDFDVEMQALVQIGEIFMRSDRILEGLVWFERAFRNAPEGTAIQSRSAARLALAYLNCDDPQRIRELVPYLARGGPELYDPVYNVRLIQAGDKRFVDADYDVALLAYSLVKPFQEIANYFAREVESLEARIARAGERNMPLTHLEGELAFAQADLDRIRSTEDYTPQIRYRVGRILMAATRAREAMWAFLLHFEAFPEFPDRERVLYFAFLQAVEVDHPEQIEAVGERYLANDDFRKFPDMIYQQLVLFHFNKDNGAKLLSLCDRYLGNPLRDGTTARILNILGSYLTGHDRYEELLARFSDYRARFAGQPEVAEVATYWQIIAQLTNGDYRTVVEDIQSHLADFPASQFREDLTFRLGVGYQGQQLNEEADEQYRRFVAAYPESLLRSEAELALGDLAKARRSLEEALGHYRLAREKAVRIPILRRATFSEAEVWEKVGDVDNAVGLLRGFVDNHGDADAGDEALYRLAQLYGRAGRLPERFAADLEAFERYGSDPNRVAVDEILSEALLDERRYREVFGGTLALIRDLKDDPEFAKKLLLDRAYQYRVFEVDRSYEVDRDFKKLFVRDRDFRSRMEKNPSPVLEEQERIYMAKVAALPDPSFADRMRDLAGADEWSLAVRAIGALSNIESQTAALDPESLDQASPRVLLWQAENHRQQRTGEAEGLLLRAYQTYPLTDPGKLALWELARLYDRPDASPEELEKALGHMRRFLDLHFGFEGEGTAWIEFGSLLRRLGRHDEARDAFAYVLKNREWIGRDHGFALLGLGRSYHDQRAYAEAHGFFERVLVAYAGFPEVAAAGYYEDLRTLRAMGEAAGVKQTLEEFLSIPAMEETEYFPKVIEEFRNG